MQEVFIALIVFSSIYAVIHLFVRRKERLMLIEKNVVPTDFKVDTNYFSSMKLGVFLIGIGIGCLLGNFLVRYTLLEAEIAYFAMIFIFGGISLVISNLVEKQKRSS